MAKQLNLIAEGQVVPTALHTEMQQSYLEYAMSVIVGRALPDVQDGLKPVHRRILYAMHELGLTPDRPYRKCARVVGDVLGKYHPHGDQSVYDALVRLVQTFSSRYPLLAGHGNFGSVDNDPPAAMRYTETRLAPVGNEALLSEIGEATIDYTNNFDNSQQEPVVLPAQLPFLILNGSSGIAVGMATNIPPHNLREVVDGLIALIDRPTLSDAELFRLIPAPDFPTGGELIDISGVREAYRTGRGTFPLRGIAQLEQVQTARGRQRDALVVTELPYQVNKAAWIEKVAYLANHGKVDGIADLRDESDRDGMRVVIELKRDTDPNQLLETLYKLTPLQTTFGAIFLSLVDGQPRQLPLRTALQYFLDFRETTLNRLYRYEYNKASDRSHLVEGLLTALANLDAVIELLRQAPDGSTAEAQLQSRFDLTERQASAILGMPLRRLTGLERQKLQTEHDELTSQMQSLDRLLNNRRELLKVLKKDLRALKRKYGDDRRTRLPDLSNEPDRPEDLEPKSPTPILPNEPTSPPEEDDAMAAEAPATPPDSPDAANSSSTPPSATISTVEEPGPSEPIEDLAVEPTGEPAGDLGTPAIAEPRSQTSAAPNQSPSKTSRETINVADDVIWHDRVDAVGSPSRAKSTPNPSTQDAPLLYALADATETRVEVIQGGYARRRSLPTTEDTPSPAKITTPPVLTLPIAPAPQPSPTNPEIIQTYTTTNQALLLTITGQGRLFPLSVNRLPLTQTDSHRGTSLVALLPGSSHDQEQITFQFIPPAANQRQPDIVLLSQQGRIKRVALTEIADVTPRGLSIIKLKEDDLLTHTTLLYPQEDLVLATCGGRLLRIANADLPTLSRGTQGQPALRLRQSETVVGCVAASPESSLIMLSAHGYLKVAPVEAIRLTRLGGLGMQGFQFTNRQDSLTIVLPALPEKVLVITTTHDRTVQVAIPALLRLDHDVQLLTLAAEELVHTAILTDAPLR